MREFWRETAIHARLAAGITNRLNYDRVGWSGLLSGLVAFVICLQFWYAPPALAATPPAESWGCYDPQPGHPTAAERAAFVREISPAAQEAESRYGVPAPGLAAMAINESGYGFTRTALQANNLFGWKDFSTSDQAFSLDCQPAKDNGNRYRIFRSFGEAVDAVGRSLGLHAKNLAYAAASRAYWQELNAGTAAQTATLHWLQAIQAGHYNPHPYYASATIRFANDYMSPGETISSTTNLYMLESTRPANTATPPSGPPDPVPTPLGQRPMAIPDDLLASVTKTIAHRYQIGGVYAVGSVNLVDMNKTTYCGPVPALDLQNQMLKPYVDGISPDAGAKLLECTYVSSEAPTSPLWVIVVLDTPNNLAKRILTACATSAADALTECANYFLDGRSNFQLGAASPYMLPAKWDRRSSYAQNSFIFPVTGWISSECAGGAVAFRDGVTIQFPNAANGKSQYCLTYATHAPIDWQKTIALTASPKLTYCFGRLAGVNRNDLPGFGTTCSSAGTKPDGFLALVRQNEIKAVNTGTDDLMIRKAARFWQALIRKPLPPAH